MHLANLGYGPTEIAERIQLPAAISKNWSNHGYYGSLKLGSRDVYQRYLGFYDGNPANLDPLPPADLARRYVDAMGGADAILAKAHTAYAAGDYRWVAELLHQLVFADPRLDLHLARGVLNYEFRPPRRTPALAVRTTPPIFDGLVSGELSLADPRGRGQAGTNGDASAWTAFTALLDDFSADFPVVTKPVSKP
ncbi:MAG: alkyl sulfatase dimerization domain-containing protein [Bryobacteraceae bacterium]